MLPPHLSQPPVSAQRARDELARSAGELIAVASGIRAPGEDEEEVRSVFFRADEIY